MDSKTDSKAQRFANTQVKEVTQQYSETIGHINHEIDAQHREIEAIKAQMDVMANGPKHFALSNTNSENDSNVLEVGTINTKSLNDDTEEV